LESIDQKHFAKTKMGYISLPQNLNAMIGIKSYFCIILKIVTLHDAIKTIHNGVTKICFFSTKRKKIRIKKTGGLRFL